MANSRLEEIRKIRLEKLAKLRELGIDPYPAKFSKSITPIAQCRNELNEKIATAGRLWAWREHGNVIFADLKDESGKIQLLFQKDSLGESWQLIKLFDVGDFIGVEGEVTKTQAGEITIKVNFVELLSKAIRPLPDEWSGLKDTEVRYRKRYLDMLLDPEVKKIFDMRTIIFKETRNYLDSLGFKEVETPIFHALYGGANAKPFLSHMNALDQDFYLRIAFELYLKRLVVGGYEKVYEIGRDFRNEGVDHTHNPEFTMIEWYEAYSDYQRVMDVAEGLFKHLAEKVGYLAIDTNKKWPRSTMASLLRKHLNLSKDIDDYSEKELLNLARANKLEVTDRNTKGQLIFLLFDKLVSKTLIEPTWVIDYPADVSPLSKPKHDNPNWVDRFEGYIGGREIFDGWSELTDPAVQRERWLFDSAAAREDQEEAQHVDEDFLEAMEYGMPPLGGIGVGMDRLTTFFTNQESLKEVILFPTLRPEVQTMPKAKQDFDQKLVIVIDPELPNWQIMNTSAHAAAFLGNKMQSEFDTGKYFVTKDGTNLPRNSQYPIVTLSASKEELKKLAEEVRTSGLLYIGYVPEMMDTTDDNNLAEKLSKKSDDQVDYAGIGIFGPKSEVDKLTKKFSLWK